MVRKQKKSRTEKTTHGKKEGEIEKGGRERQRERGGQAGGLRLKEAQGTGERLFDFVVANTVCSPQTHAQTLTAAARGEREKRGTAESSTLLHSL